MFMIKKSLHIYTESVYCCDRFAVIKMANYLIVNVYLPCNGTSNRLMLLNGLLAEVQSWIDLYDTLDLIVAGDFNADLDSSFDSASCIINNFCRHNALTRCDVLPDKKNTVTYVNTGLNQ